MDDEAVAALRRAAVGSPTSAPAQAALATALLESGRFADAVESFRAAIAIDATNPAYKGALGSALYGASHFPEAAVEFRAASADPAGDDAAYHAGLARVLIAQHKYDEAVAQFRIALSMDAGNIGYAAELGRVVRGYVGWKRAKRLTASAFIDVRSLLARDAKHAVWVIPLLLTCYLGYRSAPDFRAQLLGQRSDDTSLCANRINVTATPNG